MQKSDSSSATRNSSSGCWGIRGWGFFKGVPEDKRSTRGLRAPYGSSPRGIRDTVNGYRKD